MFALLQRHPVLMCGIILGILTLVPYLSWGAVLWALLCGAFASYGAITASTEAAVPLSKGAKLGLSVGLLAGLIYVLVATPMTADMIISNLAAAKPEAAEMFLRIQQQATIKYAISFGVSLFTALLLTVLAVLGGMLGVALLEKRKTVVAQASETPDAA